MLCSPWHFGALPFRLSIASMVFSKLCSSSKFHFFPLFTTGITIFHPLLDSLCPPTPGRAIRAKYAKQNWGNSHIPALGGFIPLMSHFPMLQTPQILHGHQINTSGLPGPRSKPRSKLNFAGFPFPISTAKSRGR